MTWYRLGFKVSSNKKTKRNRLLARKAPSSDQPVVVEFRVFHKVEANYVLYLFYSNCLIYVAGNQNKQRTFIGSVRGPVSRVLSSVVPRDGHSSGTPVAGRLTRPTRAAGAETRLSVAGLPPLHGLAPGGVCPADGVAAIAVRSYRTLSPLPVDPKADGRFVLCGTFPGVAPAGRYPAPCFHGARTFLPRRSGSGHPVL